MRWRKLTGIFCCFKCYKLNGGDCLRRKKGEDLPKGKEYSTRYLSDKGLKLLIVIKLVGRE